MCGIAGFMTTTPSTWEQMAARGTAMAATLTHRGPDDSGVWADARAGLVLAHRRLAVVDLSQNGSQPMVSADGRYVLTYNGEIYNHRALRLRLEAQGVRLRGHSDTEVLLETVARTSLEEALALSNGMFALALWDRREEVLALARDRIGEKPLYYTWTRAEFLFASELTALEADSPSRRDIDPDSLALFVRHGFVPGQHTIYHGVLKLPPGHVLRLSRDLRERPRPESYWSFRDLTLDSHGRQNGVDSDPEMIDRAESLLQNAVSMRMVADVPLGAFLSGGVDSSLVVALMQRSAQRPVQTFTVSVGGQYDETAPAADLAAFLGTDHTAVRLSEGDALSQAMRVPTLYDEPFADPSAIPTALIARVARKHVTVCLTGDGGDEMLAGYNRYLSTHRSLAALRNLPAPTRAALARMIMRAAPEAWQSVGARLPGLRHVPDLGTKAHKLAELLESTDMRTAYDRLSRVLEPGSVLLSHREQADTAHGDELSHLDALHYMLYMDGTVTLPDDMLVKVDRASMAASLECRVPLLDHEFVEFVWSLPARAKLRGRRRKWLLRELLLRQVPAEMVDRPKRGFDPPLADWLRGPLREWAGDLLATDRLRRQGLFDVFAVRRLWDEHMSGARNHDYQLWTLAVFQAWSSACEARPPRTTAPATTTGAKCST